MSNVGQRPSIIRLDVVFWRARGEFIGHCLQFDIVSVGKTPQDAEDQMQRLILAHINYVDENDNWEHLFRPAPTDVWQRFAEAMSRTELPRWTPRPPTTGIERMADQRRVSTQYTFA